MVKMKIEQECQDYGFFSSSTTFFTKIFLGFWSQVGLILHNS